ncbi:PRC-barrel domain-containing protein [Bacillus kexueae]|uniref:PRC-barrel domain-containing protein n=1 Tax=Aeribacillus kexueae TaxID=2078952 RepID=UPI001FB009B6|nr:PRC-barrel domain-containing protein [Bacillus kexueae]
MRTFKNLKGFPVYLSDGREIGKTKDLLLREDGKVDGFIVDGKGWFQRDYVFRISDIQSINDEKIVLNASDLAVELSEKGHRFIEKKNPILHLPVLNEEGESYGLVEDVYLSQKLDTIVAYEVTEGFFTDVTVGTTTLHVQNEQSIGKDAIILY